MSLSEGRKADRIKDPIVRSRDKTSHNTILRIGNMVLWKSLFKNTNKNKPNYIVQNDNLFQSEKMAEIQFGVWKIEWMISLFEGDPPQFKAGDTKVRGLRKNNTVYVRIKDVSGVVNEMDLQALVMVEGPNRVEELQLFFDLDEIDGDWKCTVQQSGAQSVGLAVRTDTCLFQDPPYIQFDSSLADQTPLLKEVTDPFLMNTDRDDLNELHKFERRPLYTEVCLAIGKSFRILGVHLKSKEIFSALEWAAWWAKAEGNRKKLLAQCYQLRSKFLDVYLAENATKDIPLIVCGDINDGPGFDASEMKLAASGVETLMGSIWKPALTMGNILYDELAEKDQNALDFEDLYTASFRDPIIDGSYMRVWIDHILYSRNLAGWVSDVKIWREMPGGERIYHKYPAGSDHFPVACKISLD